VKTGERMQNACVRQVFVLFHPDYDRRPRDHTGSADLNGQGSAKRSRARCMTPETTSLQHYRRWGFPPRPENIVVEKQCIGCRAFRHAGIYHG